MTVYSELILIKLVSSWTSREIIYSFFSEEPAKKGGSESHKQSAAGINSWLYEYIFKSMVVPFIELW